MSEIKNLLKLFHLILFKYWVSKKCLKLEILSLYFLMKEKEKRLQQNVLSYRVKPNNVAGIMAQQDIDGALVGGASLKDESFDAIVRFHRA